VKLPQFAPKFLNYIDGSWVESKAMEWRDVVNPALANHCQTPLTPRPSRRRDRIAATAFPDGGALLRKTASTALQDEQLLEDHVAELGRIITQENGKTFAGGRQSCAGPSKMWKWLAESPMMMQGYNLEDVPVGSTK